MANSLIWLYAAVAVFVPWRPVVKLLWRLCGGQTRRQRRQQRQQKQQKQPSEEPLHVRVLRCIDVWFTIMLLALLCFFVHQFYGMLIERVGTLSGVRRTLSNSTLCRMDAGETTRSFFRSSSAVAAYIGAYALLKVLTVAKMAMTTSHGLRHRCSETLPLVVLWEATQRRMGHALVIAFVDAVDEAGMQAERVLATYPATKSLHSIASAVRRHLVRPAALIFQMTCATIAFRSACVDDSGGASFSLVFSTVACAYRILHTARSVTLTAAMILVRVHVDAAQSGWRAGGNASENQEQGQGDEGARDSDEEDVDKRR